MIGYSGAVTSTISLAELVWVSVGLLGLVVSAWNLADAIRDEAAVDASGVNGAIREVARGNVLEEMLRVGKALAIVAGGCAAMLAPPAMKSQPISALAVIVTASVFVLAGLVVVGSLAARARRHAFNARFH